MVGVPALSDQVVSISHHPVAGEGVLDILRGDGGVAKFQLLAIFS